MKERKEGKRERRREGEREKNSFWYSVYYKRQMIYEQHITSYLLGYWVTCQNIFVSLF